jgi:hypothetical protein
MEPPANAVIHASPTIPALRRQSHTFGGRVASRPLRRHDGQWLVKPVEWSCGGMCCKPEERAADHRIDTTQIPSDQGNSIKTTRTTTPTEAMFQKM